MHYIFPVSGMHLSSEKISFVGQVKCNKRKLKTFGWHSVSVVCTVTLQQEGLGVWFPGQGFSVWSRHDLLGSAWIFSEWLFVSICDTCDELLTCEGCNLSSSIDTEIGFTPLATPDRINYIKRIDGMVRKFVSKVKILTCQAWLYNITQFNVAVWMLPYNLVAFV